MRHFTDIADVLIWLRAQGVKRLQCDSRKVQRGDAFVAWPGLATDGRAFVPAALDMGAVACLVEADALDSTPLAVSADPRVASFAGLKPVTGDLAAAFYGHPSRQMDVVAITGTNGKTSTAWWLAQALTALGRRCGLMGLWVSACRPAWQTPCLEPHRTTPDPAAVQAALWLGRHGGPCLCWKRRPSASSSTGWPVPR